MKFGGTSVQDAEAMTRVINIVKKQWADNPDDQPPVVVVSAMSKVTDRLIEAGRLASDRQVEPAAQMLGDLLTRHITVASTLVKGLTAELLSDELTTEFNALIAEVRTWAAQGEVTPANADVLQAMGELASSRIVAAAFRQNGVKCVWVDSRHVLVTDSEHSAALPDMDTTAERCHTILGAAIKAGHVPVMGGFIGANEHGVTTTLGRGGSDYSAAIFGACLGVDEIQIWTDVDGMLTADPRVVSSPVLVPELSFNEASELAYFGAKVLHPSTILPAVAKNIPVRILNSRRPEVRGTMITAEGRSGGGTLTALACKRGVTVIDITSSRMLMAFGFLRRLFEVFERFKTPVDVVTTSEVSVSVTVDTTRRLDDIISNLRNFAEVSTKPDMAIVCIVGENLKSDPTLFARAVTALEKIPLRLVSQAGSRRNITFVMSDSDVVAAMNLLHDQFFSVKVGV